jgi:hypothetical protein
MSSSILGRVLFSNSSLKSKTLDLTLSNCFQINSNSNISCRKFSLFSNLLNAEKVNINIGTIGHIGELNLSYL